MHLGLTLKSRQWWLIILAVGAGLETAGNALRIYGNKNSHSIHPYIAMQCIVVVTPAFFAAIHFSILGKVLTLFGRNFSTVSPKLIVPFFVSLDVASLVVQGTGSGIAAVNEIDGRDPDGAANVVVAGLAVQLFGYIVFDTLAILFASKVFSEQWQQKHERPPADLWTRKMKVGIVMAFVSALLVLLRSCFRTGEMSDGWIGPIAQKEWYYYVFDATPVTLAVLILAIWHPSQYLPHELSEATNGAALTDSSWDDPEKVAEQTSQAEQGFKEEEAQRRSWLKSIETEQLHTLVGRSDGESNAAEIALGTPRDTAGSFKSAAYQD